MVVLFLGFGLYSQTISTQLVTYAKDFYQNIVTGNKDAFKVFTQNIDSTSEILNYHDTMLDITSVKDNLLGTRVMFESEMTIVKSDSGNLVGHLSTKPYNEEDINEQVASILEVQNIVESNGSKFLYCEIPIKSFYEEVPVNYQTDTAKSKRMFNKKIQENNIPTFKIADWFESQGLKDEDIFFKTDHHWTPMAGFLVHNGICNELNNLYGFEYDSKYTNINNYNIKTYKNWFLGSYGKKCGTYYAGATVDDFDLITPKFKTDFLEEVPSRKTVKSGDFENTMLYKDYLTKDYYKKNTYATYSGGDFRLQKITNNTTKSDDKILVVRNSYACVVTPFLALHAKELHVVDIRSGDYPRGKKIDLESYIQKIQPDYVVYLM